MPILIKNLDMICTLTLLLIQIIYVIRSFKLQKYQIARSNEKRTNRNNEIHSDNYDLQKTSKNLESNQHIHGLISKLDIEERQYYRKTHTYISYSIIILFIMLYLTLKNTLVTEGFKSFVGLIEKILLSLIDITNILLIIGIFLSIIVIIYSIIFKYKHNLIIGIILLISCMILKSSILPLHIHDTLIVFKKFSTLPVTLILEKILNLLFMTSIVLSTFLIFNLNVSYIINVNLPKKKSILPILPLIMYAFFIFLIGFDTYHYAVDILIRSFMSLLNGVKEIFYYILAPSGG